jgi:hypothetical protein
MVRDRAFTPTACYPLRWHADLARIRSEIAEMDALFLDRRAIEKLFGLRACQANHLMRAFDGYRVGPFALVTARQNRKEIPKLRFATQQRIMDACRSNYDQKTRRQVRYNRWQLSVIAGNSGQWGVAIAALLGSAGYSFL